MHLALLFGMPAHGSFSKLLPDAKGATAKARKPKTRQIFQSYSEPHRDFVCYDPQRSPAGFKDLPKDSQSPLLPNALCGLCTPQELPE